MLHIQEVMLETVIKSISCTEASTYSSYSLLFPSRFSNCTSYYYIILKCTFFLIKILHPGIKKQIKKNKIILTFTNHH